MFHPEEKYNFYCKKCERNICFKCSKDCIEHENEIDKLININIINKYNFIHEKIKEKKGHSINDENNDLSKFDYESEDNNTLNKIKLVKTNNEGYLIIIKEDNKNINKINSKKEDLINIDNINNNEESSEKEFYLDLFIIVLYDYYNYPNYNHFQTISNIEKFIIFYYGEYNEMKLSYKLESDNLKNNSIKLFGNDFVNNNKENCFLIIKEKILELNRLINLFDIFGYTFKINRPYILEVYLIKKKYNKMTNLSYKFESISTLVPSPFFDSFDSINITNINHMFYKCSLMTQLPDISNWNTINVKDMSYMFCDCSLMDKLPDISKWNTKNVVNISYIFQNCESLLSLPDISSWEHSNIKYMNGIFNNCKSLSNKPDLSSWDIIKNNDVYNNNNKYKYNYRNVLFYLRNFSINNFYKSHMIISFLVVVLIFLGLDFSMAGLSKSLFFNDKNELNSNPYTYFNLDDKNKNVIDLGKKIILQWGILKKIRTTLKMKNHTSI